MDEKMIPYFSHEGDMARMERANKRLWIIILVLIVALVGSNGAWIYYESQFEDVATTTVQQDAEWEEDSNIIMNGTGEVNVDGQSEPDGNDN